MRLVFSSLWVSNFTNSKNRSTKDIKGKVAGNVSASLNKSGVPYKLCGRVTQMFAHLIDFRRDVKKGDTFKAVSNSKYISVTQDENKIKIKDNKKFTLGSSLESEVTLYIPDEFILDTANIESGAGSMYIESLYAYKLNLNLGAGKVIIDHIYSEKTDIDAGAGKFEIKSGALQNLDFDMGVGETTIYASITGKSEIDAGVGNLNINLFGDEDKYQIEFSKGIGNIKLGDRDISDGEIVGNGLETIKIDGGIGSIKVNFVNEWLVKY